MRRILVAAVLCAALVPVAACSPKSGPDTAAKSSASANASTGPSGSTGGGPGATATDKAACEAMSAKLSTWGAAFAEAAGGLTDAGSDVNKVKVIVDKTKAANSAAAAGLRAEAGKTSDPVAKKVATDLATALEKANTQLDPNQIAQNPDKFTGVFSSTEYAAAAEAYEKACGSS